MQVQQGSIAEEVEDADPPPPPAVPFVQLFAYADAVDWVLMTLGTLAAIVHGSAFPIFLFCLGKIINLFAVYRHDMNLNSDHQLSQSSYHNLADELSKVQRAVRHCPEFASLL